MIKPDWDKFKAKFSENPQKNFEWLCYSLFCKEFDKTKGIFRYKNQSGIETDPVKSGSEVIGHQAKFYEDTLGKHKDDLIDALDKTKRDYPDVTKVILYSNQEWGQARGQEPQGKKDVEAKAKGLGIELELRATSFFESPFVCVDNEIIARHFFTLDKSVFDLVERQESHSGNILNEIQTTISFNGQDIRIDRIDDLRKIKTASEQVLIVSGVGGVGKTALIKDLYEKRGELPLYIFKATEFELRTVDEFFTGYSLKDFLDFHKEDAEKIIVIDSAEKLLDIKNTDPFKEILSILIKEKWKVIFTTRENYLENLNYEFFEIYKIAPLNINIQKLEIEELTALSAKYGFALPSDENLEDLIRNPFYLNEYLKFYKEGDQINFTEFKEKLWNKTILKSKPAREQCFLKVAFQRASEGQFFISPDCESGILDNELKKDGILGYESPHGYFITHDVYEEWALEKTIELEFKKKTDNKAFFQKIGSSLPMRRAFRKWVSEKLLLQSEDVKTFIEEVIKNIDIESFWRDEILVSVLLSDFSDKFFEFAKDELLNPPEKVVTFDDSSKIVKSVLVDYKYEENTLHRIFFLLRIACKEPDEVFFRQLGLKSEGRLKFKYLFMRPKGKGWESLIKFIFENFEKIGISNIHFILPIIHDWASKFKQGETTKYCGLIALRFYEWILKEDVHISDDDTKNNLFQTIIYSSFEIKSELEEIFKKIIENKWKNHRDPYCELSKIILGKMEGVAIANVLPNYVIKMADLFWSHTPKEGHFYGRSGIDMGEYFDMEDDHLDSFPTSAYQTPIYWLLQSSLQETVDFVLNFINKTVDYFAKTEFAKYEVEEVEVFIDEDNLIKQYLSGRLWCMYRGNQAAPHVLASIHMALERFFLEYGKNWDSKILESWLIYLLKNSKSASISSVVVSIVLAYPEKTFNVACILFKTKRFFLYDTSRLVLDMGQKSQLLSLKAFGAGMNSKNQIHEQERLDASDEKHRKISLENLFLNYEIFRTEGISEEEAKKRQEKLYAILDEYYKDLPDPKKETEEDKTWRLYLARMDRRKMNIVSEKNDEGYLIKFNPEIEPELKEYSEKSLEKSSESAKYTSLRVWANYKITNDEKYKAYKQYEDNPALALKEARQIFAKLKKAKKPESFKPDLSDDESFYLLNHSIPIEVCSVMIKNYFEKLSKKDREFCVKIVLDVASLSFSPAYKYQIADGMQSVISVLPILFEKVPEERLKIKKILLLSLFSDYSIDMAGTSFNVFSTLSIQKLWKNHFNEAQSILAGYLYLKPKSEAFIEEVRGKKRKKNEYDFDQDEVMKKFLKQNKASMQKILGDDFPLADVGDIEDLDLDVLKTAFQIIPIKTGNENHKILVKKIISAFAQKLLSKEREDRIDYRTRHDFLEKLAYFVLSSPKEEIAEYLRPFLDKFNNSEAIANLFEEFITAQDYLSSRENFWEVWGLFKEKVIKACEKGDGYWYVDKVIKSYLFAQNSWKETAVEWHTFNDSNKTFFKEISDKLGHCPSTLYSVSRLLNNIGTPFLDDGIAWISDMLKNNANLATAKLETNTTYHLENLVKKYVYKNREKIKRTKVLKQTLLVILDFLIKKGSVEAYMLREGIL